MMESYLLNFTLGLVGPVYLRDQCFTVRNSKCVVRDMNWYLG